MSDETKVVKDSFAAQTANLQSACSGTKTGHHDPDVRPCSNPNGGIKPA